MDVRSFVLSGLVASLLIASPRSVTAAGGIEGTFEYALDAPWRLEPVMDRSGNATYGAIPIQLTIHDENVIPLDSFGHVNGAPSNLPTGRMVGNFCELTVTHDQTTRHFALVRLAELEMTGNATTNYKTGSWVAGQAAPAHGNCLPAQQSCEAFRNVHGTSEWHATAWYVPDVGANVGPGKDLNLILTARLTRSPQIACSSTRAADFLTLKNYVSVHYGEAPLPRFRDNRWAYGDLHFHGQGTDNEGEFGYSYGAVIRTMGSMGLDFVLASEHASDSKQILDLDYDGVIGAIFSGNLISRRGEILRDMNAERFAFLHHRLWDLGGVNRTTALDGRSSTGAAASPQNVLGHGAAPQIFLGGEVDTLPELPANFPAEGMFQYSQGPYYRLQNLCGGWEGPITRCPQDETVQQDWGVTILKDVQGYDSIHPARAHMVYFPRDYQDAGAFVASRTGVYGGASRHLTVGNDPILPELEADGRRPKGYTFLAHPVPAGSCDGGGPNLRGNQGPDVVPYSDLMYDQAFRSRAVLGLQFWNEDIRMRTATDTGTAREMGYESSTGAGDHGLRNDEPKGFVTGKFEMYPWVRYPEPSHDVACESVEWMLYYGAKQWDSMLMRGLVPSETSTIPWLPSGDPRRIYVAGGSDAHGDLNYHRAGYMLGMSQTDDMAIGKPRNLVMAGQPALVLSRTGPVTSTARSRARSEANVPPRGIRAFSQPQVLDGLINGAFTVTDGPALRIAVDRNGNGVIDDADTPMGGIVELYGAAVLPLLVEWDSTPEWGLVEQVDIVIGAVSSTQTDEKYRVLFAPTGHGARTAQTPPGPVVSGTATGGPNVNFVTRQEGYSDDPTGGRLRFNPVSFSGTRKVDIPLAWLSLGLTGPENRTMIVPDRLFVRAFARAHQRDGARCVPDPKSGACLWRYAYTNPVWAISPPGGGTCPRDRPRAIDSDGDGIPDGCDPCPRTRRNVCVAPPPDEFDRREILR